MAVHLRAARYGLETTSKRRSNEGAVGAVTAEEQEGTGRHANRERADTRPASTGDEAVAGDRIPGLRARPIDGVAMLAEVLPLDVNIRQETPEPARHPPGAAPDQGHCGGNEGHPHKEGVGQDSHSEAKRDHLDHAGSLGYEGCEHNEHDQRSGGDNPGRAGESVHDRAPGVPGAHEMLPHPRDEEDLVIHGEAEEHGHQEDRHEAEDRARHCVEKLGTPAPLEDGDNHTESGEQRQEEPDGGLHRHEHRAEHHHQQNHRQAHDDDAEGQEGVVQPGRNVNLHGGRARHRDRGAVLLVDGWCEISNALDQGGGRR